ncbi:hypothetical protein TorRG33x02_196370 [Trema orientale]|uniref:Uncharacterized protein n=1 Tax=Trema orientale TaxID=63057 RepID=A0A2P5EGA6_TREOI|nr:hypothetical protein TorRG33x02_196370 [Trema orientale]
MQVSKVKLQGHLWDTFNWCYDYLKYFQTRPVAPATTSPARWIPPSTSGFKMNVDAAISDDSQPCVGLFETLLTTLLERENPPLLFSATPHPTTDSPVYSNRVHT